MLKSKTTIWMAGGAALLMVVAMPFVGSAYWLRVFTSFMLYASLAQATNIIAGFAGYPALGNIAFFGLGAYGTAYLMVGQEWGFFPALLVGGGLIPALVAIIVGIPVLKTRGHYFVMASIALAEGLREVVTNLKFVGGGGGLTLPAPPVEPAMVNLFFYAVMLVLVVTVNLTAWGISKNRLGFALRCIKANETTAQTMGINARLYKVAGWAISALFMGLGGGAFAYWQSYIDPLMVFDILMALKFFVMMLLGGLGTVLGPLLGAFLVEFTSESIWGTFISLHVGILGLVFVLVSLFMPNGLMKVIGKFYTPNR